MGTMHGKALTVHIARHRQQPEPSRASNALNPHAELVARSMMRQHRVPAMNASRCPLATASGAFPHSPRGSQRSSRHCPTPPASLATSTRRRTFNGARSSRQLRVVDTMGAQIHHRGRPEEAHCAPVHDRPSSPPSSGATHEQVQQPVSESRMYIDDRAFVTIACHDGKLMRDGKVVENKSINASTSPGNSHVARSESFRNKWLVEKMRMEECVSVHHHSAEELLSLARL